MPASDIVIKGAREHNLRDVSLVLPRNQLICLTGVSGAGKSSLAFDTLYAEGQRRYVESLSSYARQFLGQMPKPDVDYIGGLSPVDLDQPESRRATIRARRSARSPRFTIFCACCMPASARGIARSASGRSRPSRARRSSPGSSSLPAGTKFVVLAPLDSAAKGRIQGPVRGSAEAGLRAGPRRWRRSCSSPTICRSTARCGTTSRSSSIGW